MNAENELLLVEPMNRHSRLPLASKRVRLEKLLADLRAKMKDAVETEDLEEGTAREVMETMEEDADFAHVWHVTLGAWKEEAWDWPGRCVFVAEVKDLLHDVESAYWCLRHEEEDRMRGLDK